MSIVNKIKAIIAKAKSTQHEAEAETLMAKAFKLMQEHQVDGIDLNEDDPMGTDRGDPRPKSGPSSYKPKLSMALGKYYGCKVVWEAAPVTSVKEARSPKYHVAISGPQSARVTHALMLEYVWDQVVEKAAALAAEGQGDRGQMVRHITNALIWRIQALTKEQQTQAVPTEAARNALVKIGTELEAYYAERYGDRLKTGRASITRARHSAVDAAAGINLSRQMNETGTKRIAK